MLTVVTFSVAVDLEEAVITSAPLSYGGKVEPPTHVTHIEGYQVATERTQKVRYLRSCGCHCFFCVDRQDFLEPCCLRDAGTPEC